MLLILLIFRYVQTCLHVREDLSIMSDQLVKARWFVKQEDKYNNIVFPKRRYVLDEIFGFSLEDLIRLNIRFRPIVACDRLNTVHVQNTFKGLPWGMCERIVGSNYQKFDEWWSLVQDLQLPNRNFTALLMGNNGYHNDYKYKSDTWEYKLYVNSVLVVHVLVVQRRKRQTRIITGTVVVVCFYLHDHCDQCCPCCSHFSPISQCSGTKKSLKNNKRLLRQW